MWEWLVGFLLGSATCFHRSCESGEYRKENRGIFLPSSRTSTIAISDGVTWASRFDEAFARIAWESSVEEMRGRLAIVWEDILRAYL